MKFQKLYISLFIAVLSAGFWSCEPSAPANKENTLARAGSEYLTIKEAKSDIPEFLFKQDSVKALQQYRKDWMRQQLMLQEARRLGLDQNEEVRKKIRKARKEVLRSALRDYVTNANQKDNAVTDEEARTYYQENKEQFTLDEEFVQFRHLRARTAQAARSAKQDLLDGETWSEVAREYAIEPKTAIEKSDQFWPISTALSDISILNKYLNIIGHNEISPIRRVNGVYHFVQLTDSRAKGKLPDLSWLIPKIKDWILLKKKRQNFSSFVKNLYLKAKSNNEVETFNVLSTQAKPKSTPEDTLESNQTNE